MEFYIPGGLRSAMDCKSFISGPSSLVMIERIYGKIGRSCARGYDHLQYHWPYPVLHTREGLIQGRRYRGAGGA